MVITLLVEMGLACGLAAAAGYALGRLKGVGGGKGLAILGGITLFMEALTGLLGLLPIVLLQPQALERPEMTILEIAVWTYVLAGAVGYFLTEMIGALIVEGFAVLAALLCFFPPALLGGLREWPGALGLLIAIVLVGILGPQLFSKAVLRGKGVKPLSLVWFWFCLNCLIGYGIAERLGLLLIAAPAVLIFWGFLYFLSGLILPLENEERARQEHHRRQAFRSLITFALGTNYPYYVIEDWKTQENKDQEKPDPRVPGNAFSQFLAGPGIILNDCNHVAVTTTGFRLRVVPPGLSFTEKYEDLYAVVDLRPQLRVHEGIKAETQDGITVTIFTFFPHRIGADGQQPTLGRSYPFNRDAVLDAVFRRTLIEHKWERDENKQAREDISKTPWDELVLIIGPPILKEIILNYTCNGLYAPGDPRVEIAKTFRERMREAMRPYGIEMVGGGISDIMPPDKIVEQRIQNWAASWQRRIEIEIGRTKAERILQLAPVWTQAQLKMMVTLTRILEREAVQLSDEALVFQLIDALTMVEPGEEPAQLPAPSEGDLITGMRRGR